MSECVWVLSVYLCLQSIFVCLFVYTYATRRIKMGNRTAASTEKNDRANNFGVSHLIFRFLSKVSKKEEEEEGKIIIIFSRRQPNNIFSSAVALWVLCRRTRTLYFNGAEITDRFIYANILFSFEFFCYSISSVFFSLVSHSFAISLVCASFIS